MRRTSLLLVLLAALTPALSGCFPLVAAGAGATAVVASDRRTAGTYIDDTEIELKAHDVIRDSFGPNVHVDVGSFNRNVLLVGEAPTETLKHQVEEAVQAIPNVAHVTNLISIENPTSDAVRANDALLTAKVKARYLDENKFQINYVKVITENGVVYLMGLVTHKEAADAANIAATTSGVQKVVKVFQYID
ncbi:MAG: BON domain-containing protein [Betaproteobacteria bacterium]|nr:BON domain-containing protein [Betaproteobacteria bacterium]